MFPLESMSGFPYD